jgi:hypothetical protein
MILMLLSGLTLSIAADTNCTLHPDTGLSGKHIAGLKKSLSADECCASCLERSAPAHFCGAYTWQVRTGN